MKKVSDQVSGSNNDVPAAVTSANKNVASGSIGLKYVTEDFKGFKFGVGFQSAQDFGIHGDDGSSQDDPRNSVTATSVDEIYLQYLIDGPNDPDANRGTSIKAGRQIIQTPLLINSGAFALRDAFDAVSITSKLIPDTVIQLYYIDQWVKRYGSDSDGSFVQEDVRFDNGFYSAYLRNTSIPGLTLDGQYQISDNDTNGDVPVLVLDGYQEYFARSNYNIPLDFPLSFGLLYAGASFDNEAEEDANVYGITLGTQFGPAKLALSYTSVDDDNEFPGALGHVPDALLYTNMVINNAIHAGVDAISLRSDFDFGLENLERARLVYGHFDQSDEGMENSVTKLGTVDEFDIELKYKFNSGFLEKVKLRVWAGYAKYNDLENIKEDDLFYGRFYVTYNF